MCLHVNINLHDGKTLGLVLMRIITTVHIMMNNIIIIEINEELTITATISTGELFALVQNLNNSDNNTVTYYLYSLYMVLLVMEMMIMMMEIL